MRPVAAGAVTSIAPPPPSFAVPQMTSTPFFLSRKPTPLLSSRATERERSSITLRSSFGGPGSDDAERRRLADLVEDLGRAQQRLGRDAAPVETDAAEVRVLDDGGAQAELRGADSGDVAARARRR